MVRNDTKEFSKIFIPSTLDVTIRSSIHALPDRKSVV